MTGYVKSYDKTDGVDTINSGDFEAEFNAIQSAFDQTSGHKHDGTASEGPYIQFISDSANKNKVVTDGSNNEIEFWNNASGLAVQQLSLTDGLLAPVTTNDVDLGSTSKAFKNVYSTKHGNDIFADGYTSLQAALNAATAFSTVHLRGQTYTLTSALTLSSLADITIQGPGKITTANDIVSIDISSCNRIRIKDVTLTSTHSSPSTGTGIKILNSLNVWADNCYLDGHLIGVLCADSSDQHEVYINNCLIQTTNKAGSIGIRSITGDNLFTNNVIRGYETGISVERGTHLIYYNHIYKSPSSTYNYSIDLKPYGSYGVNNVILIGNQFDNPAAAAIRFEDCDNIWEVVCIGNLFYLWQYDIPAIIFDGSGTLIDTIIRNNQFAKSGTVLTTTINPGTATLGNGVIINQNTFTNCPDYATPEYLSTFGSGSTLPLVLDSMPAGAGAAFDSVGIKTRHKNASSATKITGDIVWALQDATASSEDVDIRLDAMVAGTLTEVGRFRGTPGSTQGLRIGTGAGGEGAWNNYHLMLGPHHLWLDTQDNLRIKASVPTSETDGLIVGPSSTFINVKTYGAVGNGSNDDTTYIQSALDAAYSAGGGTVLLPIGTFVCSGITIGSNVTLMGVGNGSVLYHKDNSTDHLIQLETLDTLNIGLKNFTINGNSSNQTSVVDAIYLTGAGGTSGLIRRHTISDLYIHHVKGNGIYHGTYQRENVIHNVNTYYCDNYGIWLNGPDSQVSDCTTGQSGKYGFYITGSAYSISNVKSWCSGRITSGSHGFYLKDAIAVTIDGLYAQENSGYGVLIEGTSSASEHILVRGIIDSNNTSAGTNGALGLNNVDEAIIDVVIRSGLGGYTHQYGITVDSDVTNSHIKVACSSDELTSWLIYGNFSDSCTFSIPVLNSIATNGNVSATLNATLSKTTQIWNTPLTTDRTVTLGTGSAVWTGATFHIVRTAAATGAYNLNVGTGPLKALTAGTWCDVTFDGSAWILSGYGAL